MKIVAWLLILFGIGNIIGAIATLSSAPAEYHSQGVSSIFMGILFLGGAVFCFQRAKRKEQEKTEKEKWINGEKKEQ